MFTGDHLFILIVELCYGKPVLVDAYRRGFLSFGRHHILNHNFVDLLQQHSRTFDKAYDDLMRAFIECNKFGHPSFGLRANSWLNSPDITQISLSFHPFPINAKIGKGKCPFIDVAIFTTFIEYQYAGTYMIAIAILLFFFLGSMASFSTSRQPCAYARTTLEKRKRTGKAFIIALRLGAVMGFPLVANGFLVLYIAINLFKLYHDDNWRGLFELTIEYGFGGSSMALSDRVGGDIYPKAAIIGADDMGKFIRNILKDNLRNPSFKVGDNVRDIAGTCRSYAMPSSAALIVASIPSIGVSYNLTTLMYTSLASFVDTLVRLLTILFATDFCEIKAVEEIKLALKMKWDISIALMIVGVICAITVNFTGATMYSITVATLGLIDTITIGLAMDVPRAP
ncbi:hypothetical protein Nepgr_001173 [Nepenthes gracilis]|uniref:H(+)-exporting diphosphatase n=1 Tax=Nepenthes gracilis TaxID=150966 RepID=A0AAD3P7S7_NEPGR|nr:hypothetical protein Nepgr_001173 [Nepenthes gracilis]